MMSREGGGLWWPGLPAEDRRAPTPPFTAPGMSSGPKGGFPPPAGVGRRDGTGPTQFPPNLLGWFGPACAPRLGSLPATLSTASPCLDFCPLSFFWTSASGAHVS